MNINSGEVSPGQSPHAYLCVVQLLLEAAASGGCVCKCLTTLKLALQAGLALSGVGHKCCFLKGVLLYAESSWCILM